MLIIGLTGSIAMGKSTAATYLAERGIPLFSADEAVHELYEGEASAAVEQAFPGAVVEGRVDRGRLSAMLIERPDGFRQLEAIVHPLVDARRRAFIARHQAAGTPLIVLDEPLLYEIGGEDAVDAVLLVTTEPDIQRARVLGRAGMSEEKFALILSRQIDDQEKRRRADFIVDTSGPYAATRAQLDRVIESLHDWPRGNSG